MTKVNCEVLKCKNNWDRVCEMNEIHYVVSYGRSTDYVEEKLCREDTTR